MSKIVRTPTRAEGGITPEEKERLDKVAQEWISIALRTDPIEPGKIVPAIEGFYRAAGLKTPRVVVVPSPLVMAFAYGASAAIWHNRATDSATRSATNSATVDAESGAAMACLDLAGRFGLECAKRWWNAYQGGNMWAGSAAYIAGARDVLGLDLKEHKAYAAWEDAARHGGFRVLHPEFCIVSDFPEFIRTDDNNLPHCETGPSHRWRDGWSLYHWHGVSVPGHWIEDPDSVDPQEVLACDNVEKRAAGLAIIGLPRMLSSLDAKVIDEHENPSVGSLLEIRLDGLPDPARALKAECPRNGTIIEYVARVSDIDGLPIETAIAAQAWRNSDPASEYIHPSVRT